ncbi:PilN domain-containing protein [Lederbergia citri]|uniref:Uncharacterized protein n=1 Tax=Lederbergia citri TaxID=2833580 RepID=A0A942TBJ3_9BACI|nr:hypothetical protein [Lederbergia citri]MBS4194831.1 hypothetical protein [Lederbergia citri]
MNINLIPPRKKKSYFLFYSFLIIFIVTILFSSILFLQIQAKKDHILSLEKERQQIQKLVEIENSKLNEAQITSSTDILYETITRVEKDRIDAVPLLSHLISLLSERGFFESIDYQLDGDVQLSVQFDSSRDAAYYLHELLQSSWLTDAKIISITAKEEIEDANNKEHENVLRYTASYQLSLNKAYIKEIQSEGGTE